MSKYAGAGDVGAQELGAAVLWLIRQVFRRVEHDEVGFAQLRGQPFGRYQRTHVQPHRRKPGILECARPAANAWIGGYIQSGA